MNFYHRQAQCDWQGKKEKTCLLCKWHEDCTVTMSNTESFTLTMNDNNNLLCGRHLTLIYWKTIFNIYIYLEHIKEYNAYECKRQTDMVKVCNI